MHHCLKTKACLSESTQSRDCACAEKFIYFFAQMNIFSSKYHLCACESRCAFTNETQKKRAHGRRERVFSTGVRIFEMPDEYVIRTFCLQGHFTVGTILLVIVKVNRL